MIRLALLLLALLATPLRAEVARLTSGEHDGFTRLVVQFEGPRDWQVGRTPDGYELRIPGEQPRYDLTGVYRLIGRSRLATIWADPETGRLTIGIACACHALPFEFRPGIVVIDLRDGPPPEGSAFEAMLDPPPRPALPKTAKVASPLPLDWRALLPSIPDEPPPVLASSAVAPPPFRPAQQEAQPDPLLQPLRQDLLREFSRAVVMGLVEPVTRMPPDASITPSPPPADDAQAHITLGLKARPAPDEPADLSPQGQTCPSDDRLDFAAWGDDTPISGQMATATTALTGEFDQPDPTAVERAVRFHLFLGFGAEAAMLMRVFPISHDDTALWQSLALILDGIPDPDGPLKGMARCDGSAALWATLADPSLVPSDLDANAVARTFSALPPHLRRSLGPALAERMLTAGDARLAQVLRDAILRAPGDFDPRSNLMQARFSLAEGDAEAADAALAPLISDANPQTAEAILSLIDLHVVNSRPLDAATVTAVESLLTQSDDGPDTPRLTRAVVLARALAGDFEAAFAALPDAPDATQPLWKILADIGPDSAVLTHAIGASPRGLPQPTRNALAARLLALGFRISPCAGLAAMIKNFRPVPNWHLAAAPLRWRFYPPFHLMTPKP